MKENTELKFADGRVIRKCPRVKKNYLRGGRLGTAVDVVVGIDTDYAHRFDDELVAAEITVPATYHTVGLPRVEIINKELWPKELVTEVIRRIKESYELRDNPKALEYIVSKLTNAFKKEKEMELSDGHLLIGGLDYKFDYKGTPSAGYENLFVLGNVKRLATGVIENMPLLTIKNLFTLGYSFGFRTDPSYENNKDVWCKKLEFLLISYLNLLAGFSGYDLNKQIVYFKWLSQLNVFIREIASLPSVARNDIALF